jgi:hypothetical protein
MRSIYPFSVKTTPVNSGGGSQGTGAGSSQARPFLCEISRFDFEVDASGTVEPLGVLVHFHDEIGRLSEAAHFATQTWWWAPGAF